jgi:hypothetical protein
MHARYERLRFVYAIAVVAVAAAAMAIIFAQPARSAPTMGMSSMTRMNMSSSPTSPKSLRARFDYLSRQHSNTCMLQTSALAAMSPTARLQGACCSAMGYADYVRQIHALASYDHNLIPSDPYNISVALARKLAAFNDTILLTHAQQQVYNRAMPLATDHGPCCCHCWRWTAFEGQAKELIARRRYTAQQVARVWSLEDGCGSGKMGPGMGG